MMSAEYPIKDPSAVQKSNVDSVLFAEGVFLRSTLGEQTS